MGALTGNHMDLIVCTFDDSEVELTPDQREAMYLSLGIRPPGWPSLTGRSSDIPTGSDTQDEPDSGSPVAGPNE
jgi:hypothetical protein